MDQKQIQKKLNIFKNRVIDAYRPEKIILYGSYAQSKADSYSDVDLLVISKAFAKIPENKRFDSLYNMCHDLSPDFHVFGLTPDEYQNLSPLVSISEAKTTGINLL